MAWAKDANLGTTTGTGASLALTTSAAAAAGTWIFLGAGNFGGQTVTTVTGGGLNWQPLGARANGSVQSAIFAAYAPAGLASGTAITVTFTATTGEIKIGAVSYTGGVAGSGLDGAAATNVGSTAAWSISPSLGRNDSLVVAFAVFNTNNSSTTDANSTENLDFQFAGSSTAVLSHRIASATGSNPVGGTFGAATTWSGVAVGFTLAAAPINTLFLTGFEHGFVAAAAIAGLGLFDIVETGVTATTSSPRNGSYCCHIVHPTGATSKISKSLPANTTKVVMRFAVKVTAHPPTLNAVIAGIRPLSGSAPCLIRLTSASVLQAVIAGTIIDGPTINTTSWYVIEVQVDTFAKTLDWKVNGVSQTQATTGTTLGNCDAVFLGAELGGSNNAYTADFDDWIIGTWFDAATNWYGDGKVLAQLPASTPASATPGSLSPGDAGTAYTAGTVVNAHQMVDDPAATLGWTATRSTTDNIALRTATPGAYAEIAPATTAETGQANAVRAIMSYSSSTATANLAACDVRNSAGAIKELWGLTGGVGKAYNVTTNNFKAEMITQPVAGWTAAEVNAIRFRFGGCTSADISPVPTVQAMMLEVDWPIAAAPPPEEIPQLAMAPYQGA